MSITSKYCWIALAAVLAAPAAHASQPPRLTLAAEAGYMRYTMDDILDWTAELHGPVGGGSLTLTWEAVHGIRGGARIRGLYGDAASGSITFFRGLLADASDESTGPASAWLTSWDLSLVGEGRYWYASIGVALTHLEVTTTDWDEPGYDGRHNRPHALLGGGVRLPLGEHLALRVGGEVGTALVTNWWLQAHGSLELRF